MGRRIIELVQVLVDRIEKNGYQQRAREDDIADVYKRLTEAEGWVLHWKQARKDAHEAGELMQAEIAALKTQLAEVKQQLVDTSDDYEGQIAAAEALIDPDANGETTIAGMADEILSLRKELDAARAETVEIRRQRNNETDRLNATNVVSVQQHDEIAYLRARLDEERSVSATLREQLDAALAASRNEITAELDAEEDTCPGT